MQSQLVDRVGRWVAAMGIDPRRAPGPAALEQAFRGVADPCRPGAPRQEIEAWQRRHGYRLPRGLRVWLELSNGFYLEGPLIHPLSAIGPMVPFARVPELVVQPESWFELGNPNVETVCVDLGYSWPGGGHPIFTSGDDQTQSTPRVIARSFDDWFLALLDHGGREYWFDPDFQDLGHPWPAHQTHVPIPPLPDRLQPLASRVKTLMGPGIDDRTIASELGITLGDVETLLRHLQHGPSRVNGS